jgi:hypothetical protein
MFKEDKKKFYRRKWRIQKVYTVGGECRDNDGDNDELEAPHEIEMISSSY